MNYFDYFQVITLIIFLLSYLSVFLFSALP